MSDALDLDDDKPRKKGKFKFLAMLAGLAGGISVFLKRKREAELDEALWEDPQDA